MSKRITTAVSVDAVKPNKIHQIDVPDAKVAGLALRVTPSGAKSWTFRYRNIGRQQKRINLGRYPAVRLVEARDAAYRVLASLAEGGDPAAEKKGQKARARARARQLESVGDLIERYLVDAEIGRHKPNGRPKRAGTVALDRYYFERLVKPKFGNLSLHDLTRSHVQAFLNDVARAGASNARHCRNVIRQAYNYAIRREITDKNPATLAELSRLVSRERVLTDAELRLIWKRSAESRPVRQDRNVAFNRAGALPNGGSTPARRRSLWHPCARDKPRGADVDPYSGPPHQEPQDARCSPLEF